MVDEGEESFSITELANEFDITTRTIRFYEDKQLLSPKRKGRNRVYDRTDRTRLMLVLRGKRLGFSLDEIREILDLYGTKGGESEQLKRTLRKLHENRTALMRQRRDIDVSLVELERIEKKCHQQLNEAGIEVDAFESGL